MSKRDDLECLDDIRESLNRCTQYVGGLDYQAFLADTKTQDAVIRNLAVIGEATKNLSDAFRKKHQEIPWKNMAGVRDRLIHHYFGVNLDIVWQIVTLELLQVAMQLEAIKDKCRRG